MGLQLLRIGDIAPAFTALNQDSKLISLADFIGQTVVLYFYPKAMTPGCTTQACGLRDCANELAQHHAVVLGVSPDEPKKLTQFIAKEQLNFDLLSDPDHHLSESYKVWGMKKFMGREYEGIHRITYIIGPDGKIAHVMPKVNTKTHHQDILQALAAI